MSSKATAAVPEPVAQPPELSPMEQFLEKNFRSILVGISGLLVVVIVVGLLRYHNRQEAEAAAMESAKVKTVEDCDLVVQHHPGSVGAGNALLAKAKLLWDQNKKDTSLATLREFTQKYTDHPFYTQGMLCLGSRLEAMGGKGEVAEAKSIFEKVAADKGKADLVGLAQMRLADMLWNEGKEEEAKKAYEALPTKLTGSPFFDDNEERLKWVVSGLPTKEVDGPKPPPEPPASLKAPAATAPKINLKSGEGSSPLGLGMPNLKVTPAPADGKPAATNLKVGQPVAIPAPPKPGVVTPGAALPVPSAPSGQPSTSPAGQPKQGVVTSQPIVVPGPPAAEAKPAAPPAAPAAASPSPTAPAVDKK